MKRIKSKYESEYVDADEYVIVNNNDTDLHPVIISLPEPPQIHLIEGYGLPARDQRFARVTIPNELIDLEKEALDIVKKKVSSNQNNIVTLYKIQKVFWELLYNRHKELKKEISFIRRVWWWRINGYWCFIKGKPTWLPPRFFYYLNFFTMDTASGYADYRDCDRREYAFKNYCFTATETFEKIDKFGSAIPEDDGTYKTIPTIGRICFGDAQTKNRRRGNTSKACSDGMEVVTRTIGTSGFGIQSYTEDSAKSHFKEKVMPAWDRLPIWLKPYSTSGRNSDVLKFDVPKNEYGVKGLGTKVGYATTASSKFFDGKKMIYLLTDEEGKTSNCSVSKRWGVNKHTLALGDGKIIRGYSSHPSTVDQLTDGSGDYQFLLTSSSFYKRIASKGQTPSGLFRIFIPAQDGLEGFIDSYGYSVTGEVKDYQKAEGHKQTAEDYLQGELDLLLNENTPESMGKYREKKQLFPMRYSDSWMGSAGDVGFDMEKIDARLSELRREDNTVRGDLEWKNGIFGGDVVFVHDSVNGRFTISKMPPDIISNKKVRVKYFNAFSQKMEDAWRPETAGMFTAGVDTFKTGGKTEQRLGDSIGKKSRHSDGGLAILWNYDASVDGDISKYDWKSYKFVMTYRHIHPDTDIFNEDVLKSCIFFGAMCYPEMNISNTYEFFVKRGYGGYLLYDINKYTGRIKDKPGIDTLERSKQEIFAAWRDYISHRAHVEEHVELLMELKNITGMEYMRFFDLVAAGGVALIGAKSSYVDTINRVNDNDYDLSDFIGF